MPGFCDTLLAQPRIKPGTQPYGRLLSCLSALFSPPMLPQSGLFCLCACVGGWGMEGVVPGLQGIPMGAPRGLDTLPGVPPSPCGHSWMSLQTELSPVVCTGIYEAFVCFQTSVPVPVTAISQSSPPPTPRTSCLRPSCFAFLPEFICWREINYAVPCVPRMNATGLPSSIV